MEATQSTLNSDEYLPDASRHEMAPTQLSRMAWAGVLGPVLFTAGFLVQEALRRTEYDPVSETVSALAAGPNGWMQHVNFAVFGVLTMAFAVGLHDGLRPSKAGIAGPALLFTSGIGLVLAAVFPLREDAAGITYDPGGHIVAGITFFVSSAVGLIVVSRRLASDRRWRTLAPYTLVAGIVALVGFVLGGRLVMPEGAPLHEWAGLYQRVLIIAAIFPCRVALSVRLLQVAMARRGNG